MKVCVSADGKHYFIVIGAMMLCLHCGREQVYTENHSENWKRATK